MFVGEHKINAPSDVLREVKAEAFFVHPNIHADANERGKMRLNDIGLIKLATPIEFSENVRPICLPDPTNKYEHEEVQLAGWGQPERSKSSIVLASKYTVKILHAESW